MSNIIDVVIDSWDGKCVPFGDIIYFMVVRTHGKCHPQVFVQEYKENSTLTRFYKVIIQQILKIFSENLFFTGFVLYGCCFTGLKPSISLMS